MTNIKFAVANLKGGCGKSTLALNIASGLVLRGKTSLLDADPQGTLKHWLKDDSVEGMPSVLAASSDLVKDLEHLSSLNQFVVVDCPPTLENNIIATVLEKVDILLIPVLPSPPDLWSSIHMVDAVKQAKILNPSLKAYFVLNQVESKSALSSAMLQAIAFCGLPVLKNTVERRAAYRWAALEGISVYLFGARGKKATNDIESIIEEVLNNE